MRNESYESASCGLSNIVYCSHENPAQTEKLDKINPDTNLIKYEDLSSDTPLSAPIVAGSDLAVIMYTSGTTGTWFDPTDIIYDLVYNAFYMML